MNEVRGIIDLLLDAFILEYFEAQAGEQGVQVLINQVLAEYIHNLNLKSKID
ncbi:MAG: hypothetical protein RMY34_12310 [Aulosira sp. DedQUE10]|nr:hypothetical protein [Aulosira sp. DedQUE10]